MDSDNENQPLVTDTLEDGEPRTRVTRGLKSAAKWSRENLLLLLTVLSVVVGLVLGVSIRQGHPGRIAVELVSFPGEIFLRALKMLILPLIMFSLMAGLGSLSGKVASSLGWRTMAYYLSTTTMAIVVGIVLVLVIKPGSRGRVETPCSNFSHSSSLHQIDTLDSVLDLLRNVVPDNLFAATFQQAQTAYHEEVVVSWKECILQNNETFTNCTAAREDINAMGLDCHNATKTIKTVRVGSRDGMNILGIVTFSIVFAMFLSRLGEQGKKVVEIVKVLNEVVMLLVKFIMWYSPIGIASIIAGKLLEVEDFATLFQQIGLYMATVMVGLFIHGCITLPLLYLLLTRSNPLKMVKGSLLALVTAFGTSSSSATLPVTIQCLEKLGINSHVTRFMLPVGATINMDGTALYEAVAALFIAQVENVEMGFVKIIIISITATAASMGAAGVPSAGLVTLLIVLVAVGLPPEDVGVLLAVDWLLDRFRTTVNVLGDCYGAGVVDHFSKKLLSGSNVDPHPNRELCTTPVSANNIGEPSSLADTSQDENELAISNMDKPQIVESTLTLDQTEVDGCYGRTSPKENASTLVQPVPGDQDTSL